MTTKAVLDLAPENGSISTIIKGDPKVYFADFNAHPTHNQWILAIKADHHASTIAAIENTLVVINTSSMETSTIASGADFYTFPRFSPDGMRVCWIQFSFPNMP